MRIKRPEGYVYILNDFDVNDINQVAKYYTMDGWYDFLDPDIPIKTEVNSKYIIKNNLGKFEFACFLTIIEDYYSPIFECSFDSKEKFNRYYKLRVFL